jgi:hypothetical protein
MNELLPQNNLYINFGILYFELPAQYTGYDPKGRSCMDSYKFSFPEPVSQKYDAASQLFFKNTESVCISDFYFNLTKVLFFC